jgi:hypothetical protein
VVTDHVFSRHAAAGMSAAYGSLVPQTRARAARPGQEGQADDEHSGLRAGLQRTVMALLCSPGKPDGGIRHLRGMPGMTLRTLRTTLKADYARNSDPLSLVTVSVFRLGQYAITRPPVRLAWRVVNLAWTPAADRSRDLLGDGMRTGPAAGPRRPRRHPPPGREDRA